MNYSIGSIADLISGKATPNKSKVIAQNVKLSTPSETNKSPTKSKKKILKIKYTNQPKNSLQERNKTKILQAGDNNNVCPTLYTKTDSVPKLTNAEKRIKAKKSKQNVMAKLKHNMCKDRTVFVGNVAIGTTKTQLKKLFSVYGPIESIRFRSIPVPDEKTPKKLAAIKQQFHSNRTSLHSYIKFESAEDSQKALVENGRIHNAHHLRVSHCNVDVTLPRDESRAVFVGNLNFDCEEEELWAAFGECGPIESVRIIRDRRISIGKGFGYVNFISADSVQIALHLDNDVTVRNRQLRISACNTSFKNKRKPVKRKQSPSSETTVPIKKNNAGGQNLSKQGANVANFRGLKFTDMQKKKKLDKGATRKLKIAKLFTPKVAST